MGATRTAGQAIVATAPWQAELNFVRQPLGNIEQDDCVVRLKLQDRYPVLPEALYPQ